MRSGRASGSPRTSAAAASRFQATRVAQLLSDAPHLGGGYEQRIHVTGETLAVIGQCHRGPGDKLRLPAKRTVKNQVRFLKPVIKIKPSKKNVAIGSSVTVKVSLGKTHGNRKLRVFACYESTPIEKCTKLVAHQNLTKKSSFSFTYKIHRTTRFRVVFKGDTQYKARTVTKFVLAYPHSTVTMLGATSHAGGYAIYHNAKARAKVHVSPPLPKEWAFVEVQAYAKGRWQSAGASGFFQLDKHSSGTVELTGTWPKNVRYRMRAHTEGDVDYLQARGPWAYFRFT